MKNKYILIFTACTLLSQSCRKFIEVDLGRDLVDANLIFKDDATATSAVTAIYYEMLNSALLSGFTRLSQTGGLSSDELYQNVPNNHGGPFEQSELTGTEMILENTWGALYKAIYQSNAVLEGLSDNTAVSPAVKEQLMGEAYLMRAYGHFYLVNFFGDVPLTLTTDYIANSRLGKTPVAGIYDQIEKDLLAAAQHLPEAYVREERFRPNKATAQAFLARTYLYMEDWANAEKYAGLVIDRPAYALMPDPDLLFSKNSDETIWQFAQTYPMVCTWEAVDFIITNTPVGNPILRTSLVNSFEPGDLRREKWIGSYTNGSGTWYYPYKYKVVEPLPAATEFLAVFGLAEQYLIRAEARIHLDDVEHGIADINMLRAKRRAAPTTAVPAPLPALSTSMSMPDALMAVEVERRHELFTEWAHRWFDLKRTGRADAVLGPLKGATWQSSDVFFPIPLSETQKNPKLK